MEVTLPFGKMGEQPYNITAKDVPPTFIIARAIHRPQNPRTAARPKPDAVIDHIAYTVADFDPTKRPGLGQQAPLTPEYQKILEASLADQAAGGGGFGPDYLCISSPSWYGDSVGHYEGDTLVIDTAGVKIGRYSMVDWYGTPHTEALHVIERYRLLAPEAAKDGFERDAKQHNVGPGMRNANSLGKYLQLQFTVEDKGVFTTPWTATMTFGSNGSDPANWPEQACAENIQWYPGKNADVPWADKPEF